MAQWAPLRYWLLLSVVLPEPASPRDTWPAPESPRVELLLSPLRALEDMLPEARLAEGVEPEDMVPEDMLPEDMEPDDMLPGVGFSLLVVPMDESLPMSRVVWAWTGALTSTKAAEAAMAVCRIVEVRVERMACFLGM